MDYKVELVARAIHAAEQEKCPWDSEPAVSKERFRGYARNAINLLDNDIGILLLALEEAIAEEYVGRPRAA